MASAESAIAVCVRLRPLNQREMAEQSNDHLRWEYNDRRAQPTSPLFVVLRAGLWDVRSPLEGVCGSTRLPAARAARRRVRGARATVWRVCTAAAHESGAPALEPRRGHARGHLALQWAPPLHGRCLERHSSAYTHTPHLFAHRRAGASSSTATFRARSGLTTRSSARAPRTRPSTRRQPRASCRRPCRGTTVSRAASCYLSAFDSHEFDSSTTNQTVSITCVPFLSRCAPVSLAGTVFAYGENNLRENT